MTIPTYLLVVAPTPEIGTSQSHQSGRSILDTTWRMSILLKLSTEMDMKVKIGGLMKIYVGYSHTLLGMWLLIHTRIKVNLFIQLERECQSWEWKLLQCTDFHLWSRKWWSFGNTKACFNTELPTFEHKWRNDKKVHLILYELKVQLGGWYIVLCSSWCI